MIINLSLNKDLFVPKFFPYLFDYSHRWELYMGSAGSAKSYFITQKLIIRACREKIRIIACRRYGTTIRNSIFNLLVEILDKWKISQYCKINQGDMRITFPNGSEIITLSLDDEQKLLSFNNASVAFVDEATECNQDIIEQLNLRLRGHSDNQQIILAWNPISKNHWLYNFTNNPPENTLYLHSTYKDNPFLKPEYIKSLKELEVRNPSKARVYCFGEWGVATEGLVFSNWTKDILDENELAKKYEHRVGSDLGFVDPSTIVSSYYDRDNKIIYITKCFYKSGQTLDNILDAIRKMGLSKSLIYFDSAEPRTIDFFKRNGINARPCIKGQGSVQSRITFLQNHTIIIDESCVDLINEFENFSYILDKKTNQYKDDEYTHEYSHGIDGLGYAYSDIYSRGQVKILDKSILGL